MYPSSRRSQGIVPYTEQSREDQTLGFYLSYHEQILSVWIWKFLAFPRENVSENEAQLKEEVRDHIESKTSMLHQVNKLILILTY